MRKTTLLSLLLPTAVILSSNAEVLPLKLVKSPVEIREFIPDAQISALKPGTELRGIRGRTVEKQLPGQPQKLTVFHTVKAVGKGLACGMRNTIPVDIDRTYKIQVTYASGIEGVKLEVHSYGFGTWGDTVGVKRFSLPVSKELKTCEFRYQPAPGAICAGLWFSAPKKSAGEFHLARFSMTGYGWGGLPPQKPTANADYLVSRDVRNSKPIHSLYHGPKSQMLFRRNELSGFGAIRIPLGAMLPAEKGNYKIDLILRELGKGPVRKQYSGGIELKDDSLPELAVDLGIPDRSQELHYKTWNADGKLIRNDFLILRKFSRTPLKDGRAYQQMAAVEEASPSGFLTINAGKEKIRTFAPQTLLSAAVSVGSPARDSVLDVKIRDFTGTILKTEQRKIPSGKNGSLKVEAKVPVPEVYEICAELKDNSGTLLDSSVLQIGYKAPVQPFTRPSHPEVYFSEELATPSERYAGSAMNTVKRYVAAARKHGSTVAGFGIDIASFNPLPGVYRFAELDRRIAEATRLGLKSEIYLHLHGAWVPYADYEQPVDQNGIRDNVPSIASDAVRQVVGDAFAALGAYFRGNPDVVGFGHWGPFFDWYYRDGSGRHYDYSPSALAQWKQFSGGMEPPRTFRKETDLSPQWRKWAEFRSFLMHRWLIETVGEKLRGYEKERPLFAYTMAGGLGDVELLWPEFKRLNMFPAHGGSDSWDIPRHLELAAQRGLIFRHESVAAPERHVLYVDPQIVHGLQGGVSNGSRPFWNIAWNIGFNVTADNPGVQAALERRKLLLELVRQMYREQYERDPIRWAQLYSWDKMMLKVKNFQWNALGSDLFAGNRCEHLSSEAVSDRTPLENWKKYPLIAAFTPGVWTPETVEIMKQYLKQGGTLSLILSDDNDGKAVRDAFGIKVSGKGKKRISGRGNGSIFPRTRTVVLDCTAEYRLPADFSPLLTDKNGSPAAWQTRYGKGHLLLFAGTINHSKSKGYLEDLLKSVGLKRKIQLSMGKPEQSLMGIEFRNPKGEVMVWFYNSLLWNGYSRLYARVASRPPTWDGVAEVTGRSPVKLRYFAPEAGRFHVDRWNAGTWEPLGIHTSEQLAKEGVTTELAPGENGIIRFRHIKQPQQKATAYSQLL